MSLLGQLKRRLKRLGAASRGGWATQARIAGDLSALGVRHGGVLLVHSSLKALGYVPGGAAEVIAGIEQALGPEGTLAMPTHSWEKMERGCREFDVQRTPSCVGQITETFRGLPGVVRSDHPTHSVAARGPRATWLVAGHAAAPTPCGAGTPYMRLIEAQGQILFLGCRLERNTAFHTLEAEARSKYLLLEADDAFTIVDADGKPQRRAIRRHRPGISRRFRETEPWLEAEGALRRGTVVRADSLLLEAAPLWRLGMARLEREPDWLLRPPDATR